MKKTSKGLSKKTIFSGITGAALLFLGSTQYARAIGSIENSVVSTILYAVGYFIATVMGIIISIEAWLIGVVLNINNNIFQTSLVQNGFSISLSIANMAFVLGIIVIAIATILRRESYGIKQLLWKLVVMAVLVNFGLVIMAPIFGVGSSLTQYFLNCINPSAGGCSGTGSSIQSFFTFGTYFAGAFNPQNGFTALSNAGGASGASTSGSTLTYAGAFSAAGLNVAAMVVPIFGVVFLVINTSLIVIVLAVFLIMLFIRYIYIAILAILLPFAWASYVFPSFSSHFEAWWKKFLQWTFFAPIVMFFLYLALNAMQTSNPSGAWSNNSAFNITQYMQGVTVWTAIQTFLGAQFAIIIQSFLQEILLIGLIIGGLIAANSMSIKFAGTVVSAGQSSAKAAAGWGVKRGKSAAARGARNAYQAAGGHDFTNRLATSNNRFIAAAGRGLRSVQTNKAEVETAKKNVTDNKSDYMEDIKGKMNEQDTFAHVAKGVDKGWLKSGMEFNGKKIEDILDDEAMVKRNGQGNLKKDADVLLMSNTNVRNAERAAARGGATAMVADDIKDENGNIVRDSHGNEMRKGETMDTEELRQAAMEEFTRDFKTKDAAKVDSNGAFGPNVPSATLDLRLKAVVQNPQLISTLLKDMKSPALKNFQRNYERVIDKEIGAHTAQLNTLRASAAGAPTREQAEKIEGLTEAISGLQTTKVRVPRIILNAKFGNTARTMPTPTPGPTP
jgi:hypothetical protein